MASYDHVLQASKEALGSEPFKNVNREQVIARAKQLEGTTDQPYIEAFREVLGGNFYSNNVAMQVARRVKDLEKGTNKPPFGVEKAPAPQGPGRLNPDPNASHLKATIVGEEEGIMAQQKAEFEKDPEAATHGTGGENPSGPAVNLPNVTSYNAPSVRNT